MDKVINSSNNEKMCEYCKTCICKSCEQIAWFEQALQEIRDIVSEPCIVDENCQTCNSGCMQKDILTKINEVIGVEWIR